MRKPVPPYLTFSQALRNGHLGRIEDRAYLDWVKTLPCCGCHAPADDPHHIYRSGYRGMGTKVPDYFTIPLCRPCHDNLHRDPDKWEEVNGEQIEHVALTLLRAIYDGQLRTN
jgi:hypothetical protein